MMVSHCMLIHYWVIKIRPPSVWTWQREKATQWWWQLLCAKCCDESSSHIVPLIFLKPHEVLKFPPFFFTWKWRLTNLPKAFHLVTNEARSTTIKWMGVQRWSNCITEIPGILPNSHVMRTCVHCVQLFWDPMDCIPPGSFVHRIFPGKNPGVGCHFLLQEILLTQGPNPGLLLLLHWRAHSFPLCHPRQPHMDCRISQLIQFCFSL